jgi:hypothetical protein
VLRSRELHLAAVVIFGETMSAERGSAGSVIN